MFKYIEIAGQIRKMGQKNPYRSKDKGVDRIRTDEKTVLQTVPLGHLGTTP